MTDKRIPIYESYHKARKLYVLFSGILSAWGLIGFTITENSFKGFKIDHPEALPVVIFLIWLYTLFRFLVESLHNFIKDRPPSIKAEWVLVNIVGLISIMIFGLKVFKFI